MSFFFGFCLYDVLFYHIYVHVSPLFHGCPSTFYLLICSPQYSLPRYITIQINPKRRDLFGGEDVEVVQSEKSIPHGQMPRRISDCTIELIVRLSSIVIKCHSRFDVYPNQLVRECEPLIQLYTTSTEIIQLHEVRADPMSGGGGNDDSDVGREGKDGGRDNVPTVLVLKKKMTETTGQIIVSIRPALYELVDELKTPS